MPSYPARAMVLRKTKLGEADIDPHAARRGRASDPRGREGRAQARPRSSAGASSRYTEVDMLLHTGRTPRRRHRGADGRRARGVCVRTSTGRRPQRSLRDVLDKIDARGRDRPAPVRARATRRCGAMESAPVERLPDLVVAFLVKAMAMHGYRPELDACVACAGGARRERSLLARCGRCSVRSCGTDVAAVERFRLRASVARLLLAARMADVASTRHAARGGAQSASRSYARSSHTTCPRGSRHSTSTRAS